MDTRIRIIAEAITKDAENSLKRLADLEKDLQDETTKAGDATKKQETHLNTLNDTASKSNTMFANLGKTMIGLFAVDKILQYSMEVFNLTAKFEQYNTTLKNMFQSQDVATKAMNMIKNEAAKTNWSVDQLTDSFIKLKGRGINMTSKDIQGISDVANFLKKDFGQVVEAINDVNNTERWNEIGIKAKTSGDKVSLTFNGVTKTVSRTESGILSAITGFGQLNGVMGLTADISDDLAGKKSNLGDKIDFLMVKIGNGLTPVFNFLLDLFLKGADFVSNFIDKSAPLTFVYGKIAEIFSTVFSIGKELFLTLFPSAKDKVFDLSTYIKYFSTVLYTVVVPFQLIKAAVVGVIDSFRVLSDASGMVWKALKGDFEGAKKDAIALETSWNALKTNGTQNFGAISKGFNKIWSDGNVEIKKSTETFDDWVANQKKGNASVVTNAKDSNKEKSKEEKEFNKQMAAEKAAFQQKITEIDNRGEEERAFERQKAMNKIFSIYSGTHDKINKVEKIAAQNSKEIGENQTKNLISRVDKETELLKDKAYEKVKFFEQIYTSNGQFLNKWYEDMNDRERQAFDYSLGMMRDMLANMNYELDQQLDGATTNLEKAIIKNQKAWIGVADSAIGSVEQLAQGNFVGAIVGGVTTVFKAIDTAADRTYELELARIEDLRIAAEKFGQELLDASSKIINTEDINEFKNLYGSVFTEVVATWKSEDVASVFGFQQAIDNEKQVAESINRNFEVAKTKEEELYQQKIKSINDAYNLDVEKINAKYDLLTTKNNQRFDAESLSIQKVVNEDLMGFVTNQDLKLGLLSQYNGKRAEIESRFALSYTPIVEGMTQAEIDGINASIQARDAALAQLESWQTTQIQFVIDNGKLERDTFTETQKIIAKGKDDQYLLSLEFKQKDIDLNIQKGIELDEIEKTRKENELTALNEHKASMAKIEADYYVLIGNSFNLMKSLVLGGYDEILKKAQEALDAGKITALEFNNLVNDITFKMTNLKNSFGPGNWNLPDIVPNIIPEIEPIRIPGFKNGTEMVGGVKGVDKNLAWLSNDEAVLQGDLNKKRLDAGINRFQMVEYAINYKSILDGGFQPLQIKTSALDKLEEHKAMQYLMNLNMNGVIDKLDRVESALKSIPIQNFTLDENGLSKYVETKNNVTKFKSKRLK